MSGDALPPLYQRWVDGLLGSHLAGEPRATCLECAMLPHPDRPPPPTEFHPQTKCCTFHPFLPNFLLGGVLSDAPPAAQAVFQMRLGARVGVTPYGIAPPADYRVLYDEVMKGGGGFGRIPRLRCPFYVEQGGLCGIHRQRNADCSTWFCKFEHGSRGRNFWEAVKNLLKHAERALMLHCLEAADLGAQTLHYLLNLDAARKPLETSDVNWQMSSEEYRWLWGKYAGRERELYIEAAARVRDLTWSQVLELGGAELKAWSRVVRALHEDLGRLPAQVARGSGALVQLGRRPGTVTIAAPNTRYDPFEVTTEIMDSLARLEGRPLSEALAALAAEGSPIDAALVKRLYDAQVLVGDLRAPR